MSAPKVSLAVEAAKAGKFPGRFGKREDKMLESVKDYVDASVPGNASITNDQLAGTSGTAAPGISGLSQVATVVYDFTVNGGAISTIPLNVILPAGSLVWAVTEQVLIAPTSADNLGTIKLSLPTDGDLTPTVTADGAAANLNIVNTQVPTATTAVRQLQVQIATTALTAGKIQYFIHYVQSAFASAIPNLIASLMGASSNFEILAATTVTNTGNSTVHGDLGVSPGTSITGFPPGVISSGSSHSADSAASQAQTDLTAAYNAAAALTATTDLTGQDLGGQTLTPGVYNFDTSAQLTGILTLDASGNPGGQFVFQIGSTLTTATGSSIVLANLAKSDNVVWKVGSSATIGINTAFKGNILAQVSITLNTGASMDGRALARTGAVTMDTNAAST